MLTGNFVGTGALGEKTPCGGVAQLLEGKQPEALRKAALYLPYVQGRVQGVSHVHYDVCSQDLIDRTMKENVPNEKFKACFRRIYGEL